MTNKEAPVFTTYYAAVTSIEDEDAGLAIGLHRDRSNFRNMLPLNPSGYPALYVTGSLACVAHVPRHEGGGLAEGEGSAGARTKQGARLAEGEGSAGGLSHTCLGGQQALLATADPQPVLSRCY